MTIDEAIQRKLERLSVERRQELLSYLDRLVERDAAAGLPNPRGSARGVADLTPEDFARLRREIWRGEVAG